MHKKAHSAAVLLATVVMLAGLISHPQPVHAAARAALPADRVHFGLANGPASLSWMTDSGVPWRYRYTYLAGGLYGTPWPTWQDPALPPGQYALDYMRNSAGAGYEPILPYYMLLQSHRSGADEATDDYLNLNNPTLMRDYYGNFRLLMQKAAQYGGAVVILVEPDLWGYLQQRSNNTTADAVGASVASSGDPDLAGLANNVTGFAQALQHLRDLYGPNASLAFHASMWSSMRDIGTDPDPTLSATAEADKTAAFFNSASPAGWDLVANDVDDHDAGWWEAQGQPGHWWDPTNRSLPNFARYLAWVGELHARTGKQQVAWQVPIGNQYFQSENNTCGHYQDNVAQYFLSHPADLYASGLVAVWFGAGNGCQTTNEDSQGDGVTNPGPTRDAYTAAQGWCDACNTHVATVADDDGGYLRMAVGAYYSGSAGLPVPDVGRPWTGGHDAVGVTAGASDWYFAEGFTGPSFHEYLTVLNLSPADQVVHVDYYLQGGAAPATKERPLKANARLTIDVNADVGPNQSVAAHVRTLAGTPLVVERPMYFNFNGRTGGHDVVGLSSPRKQFYFAEGYTAPGWDEYLTLANPQPSGTASIQVTYDFADGSPAKVRTYAVPAGTRATVYVNGEVGAGKEVSMVVSSDTDVVAERPMYFAYGAWSGGHVDTGAPAPAAALELAEGYVTPDFQEYLTVLNPGSTAATVDFQLMDTAGGVTHAYLNVAGNHRGTLHVNDYLPTGTSHATHVISSVPVVVERPMYFNYAGRWDGGHVATAEPMPSPGTTYYLAEGYVAGWMDEYITIANPGSAAATVAIDLHDQSGGVTPVRGLTAPAHGRLTVKVNSLLPAGTEVSAVVTATSPVLVERPMYFSY